MKSQNVITGLVAIFIVWNVVIYFWLGSSQPSNVTVSYEFSRRLSKVQADLEEQMKINQQLIQEINKQKQMWNENQNAILSHVRKKKRKGKDKSGNEGKEIEKLKFHQEKQNDGQFMAINGGNKEPNIARKFPVEDYKKTEEFHNNKEAEKPDAKEELKNRGGDDPAVQKPAGNIQEVDHQEDAVINYAKDNPVIPILVIACNRPEAIKRSLDKIIEYRKEAERFPIVVSQDCGHAETAAAIREFGDQITFIQQPNLGPIKDIPPNMRKFEGYYKISRHYKFALGYVFDQLHYDAVVIVEDDLDIAVDFFEYFAGTYHLLKEDNTLWCVSAWNDNGKENLVSDEADLLYRTDFFPGLGWMMTSDLWNELGSKWPAGFWDDWMRQPDQRRDRACIRPEISRTKTFGRIGVSNGQFYDQYLRYIRLNELFVKFTETDLSYLKKDTYDEQFLDKVYETEEETLDGLRKQSHLKSARITYNSLTKLKSIAQGIGFMSDLKSGVPRAAYHGVVSIYYDETRVYIAPPGDWNGYNLNWS